MGTEERRVMLQYNFLNGPLEETEPEFADRLVWVREHNGAVHLEVVWLLKTDTKGQLFDGRMWWVTVEFS